MGVSFHTQNRACFTAVAVKVSVGTGTSVGVPDGGTLVSVGALTRVDDTQETPKSNNKMLANEIRRRFDSIRVLRMEFYPQVVAGIADNLQIALPRLRYFADRARPIGIVSFGKGQMVGK